MMLPKCCVLVSQTPLCLAVICNKPEIVETLVENGADVNVHLKASDDYLGAKFCQPLHLASSRGHLWKLTLKKLLRASNIDLDAFNSDGWYMAHVFYLTVVCKFAQVLISVATVCRHSPRSCSF